MTPSTTVTLIEASGTKTAKYNNININDNSYYYLLTNGCK